MKTVMVILLIIFSLSLFGQTAPNFIVTDTEGNSHRLYEDYLDKGMVVVLKIFFVNCPPCNAIASATQQKYVDWGSGTGNVQFIEMTNKIGDVNSLVVFYKNTHGISFPSISSDGGALTAIQPYINGTLGQWTGTPFFAVIAPNRYVYYDVLFSNLGAVVNLAGGSTSIPPNTVNLNITNPGSAFPAGVSYILKSEDSDNPRYNITQLTNGSHQFTYPSTTFPELPKPVIILESTVNAASSLLSVSDLVTIKNHILGASLFTKESQKIAADVNGSGTVTVSDIVLIQRVIGGLITQFPNNIKSYKMLPAVIPVNVPQAGGANITISGELIKMGNVK